LCRDYRQIGKGDNARENDCFGGKARELIEAEKKMKSFGWVAEETAVEDSSLKEAVMIVSSGQKILVSP
jgi:hypothetical protein